MIVHILRDRIEVAVRELSNNEELRCEPFHGIEVNELGVFVWMNVDQYVAGVGTVLGYTADAGVTIHEDKLVCTKWTVEKYFNAGQINRNHRECEASCKIPYDIKSPDFNDGVIDTITGVIAWIRRNTLGNRHVR